MYIIYIYICILYIYVYFFLCIYIYIYIIYIICMLYIYICEIFFRFVFNPSKSSEGFQILDSTLDTHVFQVFPRLWIPFEILKHWIPLNILKITYAYKMFPQLLDLSYRQMKNKRQWRVTHNLYSIPGEKQLENKPIIYILICYSLVME